MPSKTIVTAPFEVVDKATQCEKTQFHRKVKSFIAKQKYFKAFIKVFRLSFLFLFVVTLSANGNTIAQNISLDVKNESIERVFASIKKQSGYGFAYFSDFVRSMKPVTLKVKNATIEQVMELILHGSRYTYAINGHTISLKPKPEDIKTAALASAISIRGTIVNEENEPLAGVTVQIKGTDRITITNIDGDFELSKVDPQSVLIITAVNITRHEEPLNGRDALQIRVKGRMGTLDQVQIIAYGKTSQRLNPGNVFTIKAADIEKQPVQNPLLALQGKVPGLVVTQNTGVSGGGVTVRIQGANSIGNVNNDPLYVIDGVPFVSQMLGTTILGANILGRSDTKGFVYNGVGNPLTYINPNEIESISILKDADATAIYGSRAANGAILITTKKGKQGQARIELSYEQGWGKITRTLDLLNANQYLQMRKEAFKNDNATIGKSDYDLNGLWDTTTTKDWQKELIGGTAKYTNISASTYGGTNKIQYRIGGNYNKSTTVFPGDFKDEKGSFNFSLTNTSTNLKFKSTLSASYLVDNNKLPITDFTSLAVSLAPVSPSLYNEDGSLNWGLTPTGAASWENPLASNYKLYENKTTNLIANLLLSYEIISGLSFRANLGYTNLQTNEFAANLLQSYEPRFRPNIVQEAQYSSSTIKSWIFEPQASYHLDFSTSRFDVLLGSTLQQSSGTGHTLTGQGYFSDEVLKDIRAASSVIVTGSSFANYKYNALFTRINYNLKSKYIINLTARRDGSSRFGPKNRFQNFGAIGGAWILSSENFVKRKFPVLSFAKIRGSYGTTGNDQMGDYTFYNSYSLQTYDIPYQGISPILSPGDLFNPYLQWEVTKKLQFGLDAGFMNDKVILTFNYFRNTVSNQLLHYALPNSTGFYTIQYNFPAKLLSTGYEFALMAKLNNGEKFNWSTSFNLTIPKEKVSEFPNIENSGYQDYVVVGYPLSVAREATFLGTNPQTGRYQFADRNGNPTSALVYPEDYVNLVTTYPKYYGGWTNSIMYNNFLLDFTFQFANQLGRKYLAKGTPGSFQRGLGNQPTEVLRRWQKPGDVTDIRKFSRSTIPSYMGTGAYADASFIRLKNIALSYSIPKALVNKVGIQQCSLFVHGQNLLTITDYIGMDPENRSTTSLPPLKMITVGIKATF